MKIDNEDERRFYETRRYIENNRKFLRATSFTDIVNLISVFHKSFVVC